MLNLRKTDTEEGAMNARSPSADHYAAAIVAACRDTGEDPIMCATPGADNGISPCARHYALHAILHCFPDEKAHRAAELVGASKPKQFFSNSFRLVIRRKDVGDGPKWWSNEAYDRVIRAVEAVPAPAGGERSPEQEEPALAQAVSHGADEAVVDLPKIDGPAEKPSTCQPEEDLPALPKRPVTRKPAATSRPASPPTSVSRKPSSPRPAAAAGYVSTVPYVSEKARLAAQLAEAVRNTAALQRHLPREED